MKQEVLNRVQNHYNEALQYFNQDNIVAICLQGSQNYGLEIPTSDVDTKLIVTPTLHQIASNAAPVSTTHIRDNEEHIDFKDVRLYIQTFRKQNLNFLEILFTDYEIINPLYAEEWNKLKANRENIARMNPYRAVKSMVGIALEKYHALKHPYPSKLDILATYGYDPKQLHHLLRVEEYLKRYIAGERYIDCLRPLDPEYLIQVKLGKYTLEEAEHIALAAIINIRNLEDNFLLDKKECENKEIKALLEDVQYNIIKIALRKEVKDD